MSPVQAIAFFLQFVPLEGELHDFFRPVSTSILNSVRGTPCLPSDPMQAMDSSTSPDILSLITPSFGQQLLGSTNGSIQWFQPSELLLVHDEFIKDHISQDLLSATLHRHYVNAELIYAINASLQMQLRINNITIDHLISIAQDVLTAYSSGSKHSFVASHCDEVDSGDTLSGNVGEHVINWIANWFACVEIIMYANHDLSTITLSKLKALAIVPLSSGSIVSAEGNSIFFPPNQDNSGKELL